MFALFPLSISTYEYHELCFLAINSFCLLFFLIEAGGHTTLVQEQSKRSKKKNPEETKRCCRSSSETNHQNAKQYKKQPNQLYYLPPGRLGGSEPSWAAQESSKCHKGEGGRPLLRPILNPTNNSGRVFLNKNSLSIQLLCSSGDICPCSFELCFCDRRLMKEEPTSGQKPAISILDDVSCIV